MADKTTLTRPWSSIHMLMVTHQQAKWYTQRGQDSSKTDPQSPKVGSDPISRTLHPLPPFPETAKIILSLISLWNYPAHKNITTSHFEATLTLCNGPPHSVQCVSSLNKLKGREREAAQSCPTLCYPMDSSLHQAPPSMGFSRKILDWVAVSFSRESSWPRDRTQVSGIVDRHFTIWATREVPK